MIYEIDSVKLVRIKGIPHSFTSIQNMLSNYAFNWKSLKLQFDQRQPHAAKH